MRTYLTSQKLSVRDEDAADMPNLRDSPHRSHLDAYLISQGAMSTGNGPRGCRIDQCCF